MPISQLKLELFMGGYAFILLVITPILFNYYSIDEIIEYIKNTKDFYSILIPNIIIFSYAIGMIINGLGFALTDHLFARRFKKKYFGTNYKDENNNENYKKIKPLVFEKSSTYAIQRLEFHHNNIRLIRSVILASIVALILSLYYSFFIYAIALLILLIFLLVQLNNSSNTYYKDMHEAYISLKNQPKKDTK